MTPLLKVEDLCIRFPKAGNEQAVSRVSFTVHEGDAVGIVGESGSGKSSIAQAIMRLMPYAEIRGSILFEGVDLLQLSASAMQSIRGRRIGMIFQDPMTFLNPTMPIGAQIAEGPLYHGVIHPRAIREHVLHLLHQMEIPQPEERLKQYPHQLSGGQRQRILLAIALSCRPRLLIADEPTTALDCIVQAHILKCLKMRERSTGLLLIAHDLHVVASICTTLIVLHQGAIVESGSAEQILRTPTHPYTKTLLAACLPTTSKIGCSAAPCCN